MGLMIVIFIGMGILFLILIPFRLLYLFHKWLSKKGFKKIGIFLMCCYPLFVTYNIYTAIYPTDSFYYNDFEKVTSTEIPESSEIIRKDASYPTLTGDYCSASLIELSSSDYLKLLKDLQNDEKMEKIDDIIGSEQFDFVLGNLNESQIIYKFTRKIDDYPDHFYYIYFLDDKKSIIVHVFVT